MEIKTVVMTENELRSLMLSTLREFKEAEYLEQSKDILRSRAYAKKAMKMGDQRLNDLIEAGVIQATGNGKISQYEIDKFNKNLG